MSIERLLSSFGLREKKAAVYQAVLERGSSTVLPLAQRAGINRTTAYDILEDLQIRGLVIYKEIRGRRYYQATDPRRFKHILEQQQKEVEQSLPELLALYKPSKEKPATRFFEGKEEIALIYQELLKASSIDAYGDFTRINSFYPDFPKYVQQQINRGIKIRDLVPFGTKLDELSSQYRSPKQELRYLPKDMNLETDTIIFGDSVAFISFGETVHGLIVDSKAITATQRRLFENLWEIAKA